MRRLHHGCRGAKERAVAKGAPPLERAEKRAYLPRRERQMRPPLGSPMHGQRGEGARAWKKIKDRLACVARVPRLVAVHRLDRRGDGGGAYSMARVQVKL